MAWDHSRLASLGLKEISKREAPVFLSPSIQSAFKEAETFARQAPPAWELVESGEGAGGYGLLGAGGLKAIPRALSKRDEEQGYESLRKAYKRIDAELIEMDKHIAQLELSPLRRTIVAIGVLLVVCAVAIVFIGIWQHSEIKLVGKDGAASLLLATGVSLLGTMYAKDRALRTLTSRVRIRLNACLTQEYAAARDCFTRTLDDLGAAFATARSEATEASKSE